MASEHLTAVVCDSGERVVPVGQIEPGVAAFCVEEGLTDYLRLALRLIRAHFPAAGPVRQELRQDHETDARWVILSFMIKGEWDDILDQYDAYTDEWAGGVPWPQSEKIVLHAAASRLVDDMPAEVP